MRVDDDNIKLSNTYYDATNIKPGIVGITSTSFGEFGLINPRVDAYRSSTLNFDLSDATLAHTSQSTQYSAFKLNFYLDSSCTKLWETDQTSSNFSVSRSGQPGISADAKTVVSIGNTTPDVLYYKFDPISDVALPKEKTEILSDTEVLQNNIVLCRNSVYNGNRRVSIAGTNFFKFETAEVPEANSYVSTSSSITYTTDCTHTTGPISTVRCN